MNLFKKILFIIIFIIFFIAMVGIAFIIDIDDSNAPINPLELTKNSETNNIK
jgi:hypothetical protein